MPAAFLLGLTPSIFGLTLEESKQFREKDYILNDGITIEYSGQERELYFIDNGQPYHYSRIELERDGDLFRWVELRAMKSEKYIKYVAKLKAPIPEIIVKEGFATPLAGKSAPDTICNLVYDKQTGKPKNVYLVDFETRTFDPVLEQASNELSKELGQAITTEQAVLFFYDRCSTEHYPFAQAKQEGSAIEIRTGGEIPVETGDQQLLADAREPVESTINDKVQSPNSSTQKETECCAEINNDVYIIADDAGRKERLTSFVSQLQFVDSWDWGADSYDKLFSLISIAYPIFVHYEDLTDGLKEKYVFVIDKAYDISGELYKKLPCQKRNEMNTIFKKVLGKIK